MTARRNFIKQMVAGGVLLSTAPNLLSGKDAARSNSIDNEIRIALIGKGSRGTADANSTLSVPGVKMVAVCDVYNKRLEQAKEQWGAEVFTTRDYKEILDRKDVDAVLIGTPDHWHQPIAIAAMKAGKHVYCEKPIIHKIKEGKALIDAEQVSGMHFQTGSQGMASLGNRKARQLVQSGILGKINFIDGQFTGAPRTLGGYPIPDDASENTIWWNQFIGNAPKHAYAPQRFFYWREWGDYGTGIAGDLFVHVLASLHYITDTPGPTKIYATGGMHNNTEEYTDMPDIMLGYLDYPDKDGLGAFTVQLGANYVDGVSNKWGSMDFRINGSEGSLNVGWDTITLRSVREIDLRALEKLEPIGGGIDTPQVVSPKEVVFKAADGYRGGNMDHFFNFIEGIRNNTPLVANATFGVQSAAPALLSYESYLRGEAIHWDPEHLKEIKK